MPLGTLFRKALLQLDYGRAAEAEASLKKLLSTAPSNFDDRLTVVRAKCCLGEKLFNDGRLDEARAYLHDVSSINISDPEFDPDLVSYEIDLARQLLEKIDGTAPLA